MYSYSNVARCCPRHPIDMGNTGKDMRKGRFEAEWSSVKGICLHQPHIVACASLPVHQAARDNAATRHLG